VTPTNDGEVMEDRIRDLFAAILQVDAARIHDDTDSGSLDRWDSMQHMILVSGFEEEFGIDFDPEDAVAMYATFGTFKRAVLQKLELRK
jgi:acyl carrier protein